MRALIRLSALAVFGVLALANEGKAQSFVYVGPAQVGRNVQVLPPPGYAIQTFGSPRVLPGGTYYPMYDYHAAPYPLPARLYVGLNGNNDFAFHGQPYGHPYEPWSWNGLSRYPAMPPIRVTGVVGY